MEQLCFKCWYEGSTLGCEFFLTALRITRDPNLTPEEKNTLIAVARVEAQAHGCPNTDSVEPDYEGKREL